MRYAPLILLLVVWSCSSNSEPASEAIKPDDTEAVIAFIDSLDKAATTSNRWDSVGEMPDEDCVKLRINYPGHTLKQLFNDSNYVHYAAAEALGIDPITGDSTACGIKRPLKRIESGPYYYVDELKHSYPYLVPEAAQLLDDIGRRFHDTLNARGGGNYRLKVTSLLRTSATIGRLRRVNRASVDSSAHRFGTTFDISYTRYSFDGGNAPRRTQEDLKNLLAEILYELRGEGRCYVKYERKPGCFHITARPPKR